MIFDYTSSKQNSVTIFTLRGELIDRNQPAALLAEVEKAVENNENLFLLNLEELKYVNSSGLNVIINILTKARKAGGDIAICNVSKKITELLVITRLNDIITICNSIEEAYALLTKGK